MDYRAGKMRPIKRGDFVALAIFLSDKFLSVRVALDLQSRCIPLKSLARKTRCHISKLHCLCERSRVVEAIAGLFVLEDVIHPDMPVQGTLHVTRIRILL